MGWGTTDYDPVNGNLLVYTDNEPPFVSGDPQCGKCGGMEFRWEGGCVKCHDKEIDRWDELSEYLKEFDIKRNHTIWLILQKMKELEEK